MHVLRVEHPSAVWVQELMAKAEEAGATQEMALEVVSKEMQTSLK